MTGDKPLPRIPPRWIPLTDLMPWVRRLFDLRGRRLERHLTMRLREGPHLRIVSQDGEYVRYMDGPDNWDTISDDRVNWDDGYVDAPYRPNPIRPEWDRPPERCRIEARLESVETFVGWWRREQRPGAHAALVRQAGEAPKA